MAFATIWIIASGAMLYIVTTDLVLQSHIEFAKGLAFVIITSGLLFLLLRTRREVTTAPYSVSLDEILRYERWQLALVLAILVLTVPMIGFTVFALNTKQVEQNVFDNLHGITELKVKQIEGWLAARQRDAETLAANSGFIRQVTAIQQSGDTPAREALHDQLVFLQNIFAFDSIVLLGVRGEPLAVVGMPVEMSGTLALVSSAAAAATGKVQRSDLYFDAAGRGYLSFVVPLVANGDRDPIGTLLLNINPEFFLFPHVLTWPMAGRSGETLLVRRESGMVRYLNELRYHKDSALALRFSLSNTQLTAAAALRENGVSVSCRA